MVRSPVWAATLIPQSVDFNCRKRVFHGNLRFFENKRRRALPPAALPRLFAASGTVNSHTAVKLGESPAGNTRGHGAAQRPNRKVTKISAYDSENKVLPPAIYYLGR